MATLSAVIRTTAVIMLNLSSSPRRRAHGWPTRSSRMQGQGPLGAKRRSSLGLISCLQALDVDVVERRLHEVSGLLKSHRLAPVERRLVRVERVFVRPVVVHMELLLEQVDSELHAVAGCGA